MTYEEYERKSDAHCVRWDDFRARVAGKLPATWMAYFVRIKGAETAKVPAPDQSEVLPENALRVCWRAEGHSFTLLFTDASIQYKDEVEGRVSEGVASPDSCPLEPLKRYYADFSPWSLRT